MNEAGRGNQSCQTIITHEAGKLHDIVHIYVMFLLKTVTAPTAAPIDTETYQLNSTSVFLSWRPPLTQYQNGIIRGYFIEFSLVNSTEAWFQYTTQDQHLLIDNLEPNTMYACRVSV